MVIIKNRILTLRPQRDWVGASEKVKVIAKFENKKVEETAITISVFDLPTDTEKICENDAFPVCPNKKVRSSISIYLFSYL